MPLVKPFIAGRRFYSTIGAGTGTGATFAIAATAFTNDAGVAATAFPAAPAYYNLYINAMLQTSDTSTVTTATITIPGGDVFDPATPLIIEFIIT